MSGPLDDKAFEEYLKRGSPVSQQYQSLEADDVPTELDRAILERAEQAVRKQPDAKQQRWRRWSIPVALAASTVLAVSIVLESNQIEGTSTRALTYPEPASAPAESSAQPSAESEASPESAVAPLIAAASSDVDEERPRAGRLELERRASFQERPAPAFVPPPPAPTWKEAPVDAEQLAREQASVIAKQSERAAEDRDESRRSEARRAAAPPRAAVQAQRAASTESDTSLALDATTTSAKARDAEDWLRDIRELRAAGKIDEADREWKAFREAFPDYEIADDDPAIAR